MLLILWKQSSLRPRRPRDEFQCALSPFTGKIGLNVVLGMFIQGARKPGHALTVFNRVMPAVILILSLFRLNPRII